MIDTKELRQALGAVQPEEVEKLLDRLEEAEKDAAHQKALADSALRVAKGWEERCNALRTKLTELEKQEPVMWANSSTINSSRINKERGGRGDQHTCSETQTAYHDTQLYALPGAQPQLNEIKIALQRALGLGQRETWTGARKHRSWEDQREEQQCWNKVWNLLGAQGEEK